MPEDYLNISSIRKHAAIMFTDIVGYTSLMGTNEDQAFDILHRNREIHNQLIRKYNGTLIKEIGDGFLASFSLDSDAVRCAKEIQKHCISQNIPLKIGIHEGEIVIQNKDVLGDAVNIASRLQETAEKGVIAISDAVFRNIKNKSDIKTEFLGEKTLKNIEESIKVYRVLCDEVERKTKSTISPRKSFGRSIAVLPFVNMSADPENEYFSDGLSESIINSLTKIRDFRVVARTSAFSFKGKNVDIREIGKQLDVDHILEGSVQKSGKRIRITSQLIHVSDGYHLWSERFDRTLEDVFIIQDEISIAIVEHLKLNILGSEKSQLLKRHTNNPEAYNHYLKGRYFYNKRTEEDMKRSIEYYQHALHEDPGFVLPYTGLSDSYLALGFYHFIPFKEAGIKSRQYALKGLELDPTIGETHTAYATNILCFEWRWEEAEMEYQEALRLNPSNVEAHHMYAHLLESTSRFDQGIAEMKKALEQEPISIILNNCMGNLLFFAGNLDGAITQFQKTIEMDPDFPIQYLWLGRALLQKGELKSAIKIFEKGIRFPTMNASVLGGLGLAYALAGKKKEAWKIIDQLHKLAGKKSIDNSSFAYVYMGLGEKKKTLEYLDKCIEVGDIYLFYIPIDPVFKELHSDPEFKTLLKKMGLG